MRKISIVCILLAALQSFFQNLPEKISFSAGRSIIVGNDCIRKLSADGMATTFIK